MRRRVLSLVAILLFLTLMVGGCGSKGNSQTRQRLSHRKLKKVTHSELALSAVTHLSTGLNLTTPMALCQLTAARNMLAGTMWRLQRE